MACICNKECSCGKDPDFTLEHACESQVSAFEGKISHEHREKQQCSFWAFFSGYIETKGKNTFAVEIIQIRNTNMNFDIQNNFPKQKRKGTGSLTR